MTEKACRNCRFISNGPVCPNCKSTSFSDDWSGVVVVFDPAISDIAKRMGITSTGRFAIRVR